MAIEVGNTGMLPGSFKRLQMVIVDVQAACEDSSRMELPLVRARSCRRSFAFFRGPEGSSSSFQELPHTSLDGHSFTLCRSDEQAAA
jgi:hypothetical protein